MCIVVTRYFGGTLLGTGGLVRAYTDASKAAIDATEVVMKRLVIPFSITTDYTDLGKIQYILGSEGIAIVDSEYGEGVVLKTEIFVDDVKEIEKKLVEATAARVQFDKEEPVFAIQKM